MESGSTRVEAGWWEAEALEKLRTTTNTGELEVICSLIPGVNQPAVIRCLKERPDLDTLFALHCRCQNPPIEQHAGPLGLAAEIKARELWRALQMPLEYSRPPWDCNWQPPLTGAPSEIAAGFHAAVCRAIFQVPFSDYVKCALGYSTKAHFVQSLLDDVCGVRRGLHLAFGEKPEIKELYSKVEGALTQQHHPLAHWIVASSLLLTQDAPFDALAVTPIKTVFETHDISHVLKQLAAINHGFAHVNRMYDWQMWSTDLDFWEYVDQAVWSGGVTTPLMPRYLSTEDLQKRLDFLKGFEIVAEEKARGAWSKVWSAIKVRATTVSNALRKWLAVKRSKWSVKIAEEGSGLAC